MIQSQQSWVSEQAEQLMVAVVAVRVAFAVVLRFVVYASYLFRSNSKLEANEKIIN